MAFIYKRQWQCLRAIRAYTSPPVGMRSLLQVEIKNAMRNRDSVVSTTLRALLSEIHSADKRSGDLINTSAMSELVRKAVQRRFEAASAFRVAGRKDMAEKEENEAQILSKLLPPQLTSSEIDARLESVMTTLQPPTDPRRVHGLLFKAFYANVDRSSVDPNLLKERVEVMIQKGE